jgi:hypothetical protein
VYEVAQKRSDAEFELVDIKDFNLPLLEEPVPAIRGQHSKPHTKAWATCSIALAEQWFKAGRMAPSSPRSRKIIDSGQLAPVINRILPLSEARRAHELSQSGHAYGKIVLRVWNGNGSTDKNYDRT